MLFRWPIRTIQIKCYPLLSLFRVVPVRDSVTLGCSLSGSSLVPSSEGSKITKDVTMTNVAEAVPMETKSSPEKTYVTPTAVETVATASTAPVVTKATSQRGTCRLQCQVRNTVPHTTQ